MTRYRFDQIAENSTAKKKPEESDRNRYVGLEHLDPGTLEVTRWGAEVTPKGDKLLMKKGDILFGRRRAYQKKVGIAPFDGIFSAHGMVLRPKADVVDPMFFPFFISSDIFLDEAIRVSVGSLSPTANWKDLRTLEFDLPSPGKQRELAGILSEAESLKGHYRKLLTTCDDVVKSQFAEMFGTTDCPRYPVVELESLCSDIVDCPHETPKYQGDLIHPAIRTSELEGATIKWSTMKYVSEEEYQKRIKRLKPMPGDVVYAREGTYGDAAILPPGHEFCLGQRMMLFRADPVMSTPEYLLYTLISMDVRRQADKLNTGSTVPHVNVRDAKRFKVMLPEIRLQQEFAAFAASVDKSKFAVQKALDELNATTKKILNQELGLGDV